MAACAMCRCHTTRPWFASNAHTSPFQSPTYSRSPTSSGELSDGPIVCRQWIFPWPTPNAITSPSTPCPPLCALHGGELRNASYTVPCACGPIAGDAATQRCAWYFHAYLPGLLADGGERPLVRREEQAVVADRRRELDQAPGLVAPHDAERRPERELHRARPIRREAVRRPGDRGRRGRLRRLRRDVLGRRRAALVGALVQTVNDVRAEGSAHEDGQKGDCDQRAAHLPRLMKLANGLDRVQARVSVQQQAHSVARDWHVVTVVEVEDDVTAPRFDPDDASARSSPRTRSRRRRPPRPRSARRCRPPTARGRSRPRRRRRRRCTSRRTRARPTPPATNRRTSRC